MYRSVFKLGHAVAAAPLVVIAFQYVSSNPASMDPCRSYPFDNKSFALNVNSNIYVGNNDHGRSRDCIPGIPLFLAGVGVQKQNIFFVLPTEICLMGLYLSEPLMYKTRQCLKSGGNLVEALLSHREVEEKRQNNWIAAPPTHMEPKVSIALTLKFTSTVSRKQVMELFKDAQPSSLTNDTDGSSHEVFLSMFSQFLSSSGMRLGQELSFFWYENENKLVIKKKLLNNVQIMVLTDHTEGLDVRKLRNKLLAKMLHLSQDSSFTTDLIDSVRTNIDLIEMQR